MKNVQHCISSITSQKARTRNELNKRVEQNYQCCSHLCCMRLWLLLPLMCCIVPQCTLKALINTKKKSKELTSQPKELKILQNASLLFFHPPSNSYSSIHHDERFKKKRIVKQRMTIMPKAMGNQSRKPVLLPGKTTTAVKNCSHCKIIQTLVQN